jgi:DNA (cytosine-5)-methyltransferase 1
MISSQYVNENKCVVEPFVKSSRAQTSEDSETWIPGEVNPTLNSFDVGDTRATTAIIQPVLFENSYRDGARIANDGVTQTLTSKMGTGGGNTPMIAQSVAYSIREDAKANNFSATELDHANSLSALRPSPQSHHAQMFIAEPTMAVRRLTPLECERLMGWPDDHTRYKSDGTEQADTHRYKQCGNGVASPVAQWIAKHILNI